MCEKGGALFLGCSREFRVWILRALAGLRILCVSSRVAESTPYAL